MTASLFVLALFSVLTPDRPLLPVWSPDHQVLATTEVPQRFVTPEGGNYELFFNHQIVYPRTKHPWLSSNKNQHTFLSELVWSPDSERVAFIEKVYDWEYLDPYNSDFSGWASKMRFYLAIVAKDGTARGCLLARPPENVRLEWESPFEIDLNGRTFNLENNPPAPIH